MINENKIKVAVIGCGFFATNHILSWKNFKDVDLVGVCDLDEESLKEVGQWPWPRNQLAQMTLNLFKF